MTTINLDKFEERLMQRADAEQNIANRLYSGEASKESYMQASVTAAVLREVAHSIAQMKQEFTVSVVPPEKQNVEAPPEVLREYVERLVDKIEKTQWQLPVGIRELGQKVQKALDAIEPSNKNIQEVQQFGHARLQANLTECLRIFRNIQPITSSEAGFGDLTRNEYDRFIERLEAIVEGNGFDRQYPGAEAWELEELVGAKDERIKQLEAKVENLEGHLKNDDEVISELKRKLDYFRELHEQVSSSYGSLKEDYEALKDELESESADEGKYDYTLEEIIDEYGREGIEPKDQQTARGFINKYEALFPTRFLTSFCKDDRTDDWSVEDLHSAEILKLNQVGRKTTKLVHEIIEAVYETNQ